jgi:tRNA threonylcarbamoyladenosine biosynthesis protein TsaE
MQFENVTLNTLGDVADFVLKSDKSIVLFKGDLGAGKTTLIKMICSNKGVQGEMSSPTFSIVNEYSGADDALYHFDLYRIENHEELLDIGFEDYLDSGRICLIEWPSVAENILQHYDTLMVDIQHEFEGSRRIFVS